MEPQQDQKDKHRYQRKYLAKRRAMGYTQRNIWLKDEEFEIVKETLRAIRGETKRQ